MGEATADHPEPSPSAPLLRRMADGVVWITLNRPEAGNALTPEMCTQITSWLEEASDELAVRTVVLIGTGDKGFCTGADLRSRVVEPVRPVGAPRRAVGDAARQIRAGWQRLVSAVLDCEKPVIAAVNATAAGGGMHLALACDLVLAAEEARFIEVFVRRGIAPDAGGAYLLPRLIGPQRAKELFFFGDDLLGPRSRTAGSGQPGGPGGRVAAAAGAWATRLASGPTKAISMAKYLTNRALESDRTTALWDEAMAQELDRRQRGLP